MEIKNDNLLYDAVLVLGTGMKWDKELGKWTFPHIIKNSLVLGQIQAVAAAEVHEITPYLLVTGGSEINPETGKKDSRSKELTKSILDLGVPLEKVVSIGRLQSSSTYGNFEDLAFYLRNNPEIIQEKKFAILSPRFQSERAKMILVRNNHLKDFRLSFEWLVAEEILQEKNPEYASQIEKMYDTPEARRTIRMEKKGISDLEKGIYLFKTP